MNNKTKETICERKEELEACLKIVNQRVETAPQGSLRISSNNRKVQFYHRKTPQDKNGSYIPNSNRKLAIALAQKKYDLKVVKVIQEELSAIDRILPMLPEEPAEKVYEELPALQREMVQPIVETDKMFVDRWEGVEYVGKEIDKNLPVFLTEKGERVRSKSEVIIANMLAKAGIPYRYECPLRLKRIGLVHPDFTILNVRERKEYYWEHLGRMEDDYYVNRMLERINAYIDTGLVPGDKLIITAESGRHPLQTFVIRTMIKLYCL